MEIFKDTTLDMEGEIWVDTLEFPDYYEVSNLGRVRRKANSPCRYKDAKVLRQKVQRVATPYLQVTLKNERLSEVRRGAKTVYVHSLVCAAFHGPRPEGLQCCHNDGNPQNNRPENLRWDTRRANEADRIIHGTHNRGERHGLSKLKDAQVIEIKRFLQAGKSMRSLAKEFGVSEACIYDIKEGKRWVWCATPIDGTSPIADIKVA